jgi:hypothetical protein
MSTSKDSANTCSSAVPASKQDGHRLSDVSRLVRSRLNGVLITCLFRSPWRLISYANLSPRLFI